MTNKSYVNVDVNEDINPYARVIVNGRDTGVVTKPAADQSSGAASVAVTADATSASAETNVTTLSGTYKVGDRISLGVQGDIAREGFLEQRCVLLQSMP